MSVESRDPFYIQDGHSERRGEAVAMNIYGEQDMKLFESGVATTHIREVYSYEWTYELCEKEWTY